MGHNSHPESTASMMIRIIPALIFILMAVADGQENMRNKPDIREREEQQSSAVSLAKFNFEGRVESCRKLVSDVCPANNQPRILQNPIQTESTEYIFKPEYNTYVGLPGLDVEVAKNSPVRCKKTVDNDSHHPQAIQCCMPFDYNKKTIEEIRCDGCKTTMKIDPRSKAPFKEPKWDPSTCKCRVTRGTIKKSTTHKIFKQEEEESGIKLKCPAKMRSKKECHVEFTLMKVE